MNYMDSESDKREGIYKVNNKSSDENKINFKYIKSLNLAFWLLTINSAFVYGVFFI